MHHDRLRFRVRTSSNQYLFLISVGLSGLGCACMSCVDFPHLGDFADMQRGRSCRSLFFPCRLFRASHFDDRHSDARYKIASRSACAFLREPRRLFPRLSPVRNSSPIADHALALQTTAISLGFDYSNPVLYLQIQISSSAEEPRYLQCM